MLTLYQAEWCPYSSAVREALSELGLDVVARQVPARPEDRGDMRAQTGTDEIPVLQTEDGRFLAGTEAIFEHLRTLEPWTHAAAHRGRYDDHQGAREENTTGRLLERVFPLRTGVGSDERREM